MKITIEFDTWEELEAFRADGQPEPEAKPRGRPRKQDPIPAPTPTPEPTPIAIPDPLPVAPTLAQIQIQPHQTGSATANGPAALTLAASPPPLPDTSLADAFLELAGGVVKSRGLGPEAVWGYLVEQLASRDAVNEALTGGVDALAAKAAELARAADPDRLRQLAPLMGIKLPS